MQEQSCFRVLVTEASREINTADIAMSQRDLSESGAIDFMQPLLTIQSQGHPLYIFFKNVTYPILPMRHHRFSDP